MARTFDIRPGQTNLQTYESLTFVCVDSTIFVDENQVETIRRVAIRAGNITAIRMIRDFVKSKLRENGVLGRPGIKDSKEIVEKILMLWPPTIGERLLIATEKTKDQSQADARFDRF